MSLEHDSEMWKPIDGSGGMYDISSHGRVRSWHTYGRGLAGGIKKSRVGTHGYKTIHLHLGHKKQSVEIHVLVAIAFVPGKSDGLVIVHKNGDITDNRAENLTWAVPKKPPSPPLGVPSNVGTKNGRSILTEAQVLAIRSHDRNSGGSFKELARTLGVSRWCIQSIRRGNTWKHLSSGATA